MQLTSLGFVFLLLPISAALYYCVPARAKSLALLGISAALFYLIFPDSMPLLSLSLAADSLCAALLLYRPGALVTAACFRAVLLKDLLLLAVFGLALPLIASVAVPGGLIALSLISAVSLSQLQRGALRFGTPIDFAANAMFFGRLTLGPITTPRALADRLSAPAPSLSMIGRGIMQFTVGIAKQVILAEQTTALYKTLARLPADQLSVSSAWLAALCAAFSVYFFLSSVSDMAVGLGLIFSLELPRLTYYPFQAPSVRDYLYRMNLPLEDALGRFCFGESFDRSGGDRRADLISFLSPLLLALWIHPDLGHLLWGLSLSALILLDRLFLRRLPAKIPLFARFATFLLLLPTYVLLLPVSLSAKGAIFAALFGQNGVPLINDAVLYLFSSNLVLLLIASLACLSLTSTLGRLTARHFPRLWWSCSAAFHLVLLVVTSSFLLWNVR